MQSRVYALGILLFLLQVPLVHGQVNKDREGSIDRLFTTWSAPNHPGGVVGIMKDGKVLYIKAFGQASLEYGVPNTLETTFNTGSLAKQVTAMAIVILQEEGKLGYDDQIQKFLPGFPQFDKPVTIRQLLHHTSGLRSLHDLLALAGWRGDDFRTNEDLMRFMHLQRELNFIPGSQFSYCNTGYVLLARIVERISGQPFDEWVRDRVFNPLGMPGTSVEANYQLVVPNRATSYYHSHASVYERASPYWGYTGAGNMYSTVGDLLAWTRNFYAPQEGWRDRFAQLMTFDPLNNGEPNSYRFGVFADRQKGRDRIQHAGVVGGYRGFEAVYPEYNLNTVVLANFSNAPVGELSDAIADLLLPENPENLVETTTAEPHNPSETKPLDQEALRELTGDYYSTEVETLVKIRIENGGLMLYHPRHGSLPLQPSEDLSFEGNWPFERIRFMQDNDSIDGLRVSNGRVQHLLFKRVTLPAYHSSNPNE